MACWLYVTCCVPRVQTRHTSVIIAQRTTVTDDVSDCVNAQNDDVIASVADQRAEAAIKLGSVTPPRHDDRPPTTVPLIAFHNGRALSRQSSADYDEVPLGLGLDRCSSTRRTLSLRRRLLTVDAADHLVHDRYIEQVSATLLPQIILNFLLR